MIDDKKAHERQTKAKEDATYQEVAAKERLAKQQEEIENQRRRDQFKQDAIDHWEESKRIKAQQKEEEKRNDQAMKGLFDARQTDDI